MNKKKIGVITMHKVWNFGSALQTYATQYIIESLGYECEIIDYTYPNLEHSAFQNTILRPKDLSLNMIVRILISKLKSYIVKQEADLFECFYSENYHCSSKKYSSRSELLQAMPQYDVYLTGSDQVWNPKYIGFDTNFMLAFAPKQATKISYASSFAIETIPAYLKDIYKKELTDYKFISVRESSGKKLIKELTGKNAEVVCDPTLLLNANQWDKLAQKSNFKINEPYLLVYLLGYAYNPYPEVYSYIERVNNKLNLPVIYLNAKPGYLKKKYRQIDISLKGPYEFLYLVSHASFVITDSFHGTAFSVNFNKRFMSCIETRDNGDSRILDLLRTVGLEDRAVVCKLNEPINFNQLSSESQQALDMYRKKSIEFLARSIES